MAYPAGVTTATISAGVPFDVLGDDGTVTLSVKPYFGGTTARIIHAASGRPFIDSARSGTPSGGSVSVVVPHVDQTGFVDGSGDAFTMWSYVCTVTMTVQGSAATWTQAVQPLVGQDTIDLDLVEDGTVGAPSSSPVPAVTSVNGQTGAVTVAGGGGATNLSASRNGTTVTVASDTGTDATLVAADGSNAGVMTAAQQTKLAGVATGATANATDAQLRDRATHTGAQAISTITGLQTALDAKADAGIEGLPAGAAVVAAKSGGTWPARPTARGDIVVMWKGPDPSPDIVSSGTAGMRDGVDLRLVTP
jgi:hypothetical protein